MIYLPHGHEPIGPMGPMGKTMDVMAALPAPAPDPRHVGC